MVYSTRSRFWMFRHSPHELTSDHICQLSASSSNFFQLLVWVKRLLVISIQCRQLQLQLLHYFPPRQPSQVEVPWSTNMGIFHEHTWDLSIENWGLLNWTILNMGFSRKWWLSPLELLDFGRPYFLNKSIFTRYHIYHSNKIQQL